MHHGWKPDDLLSFTALFISLVSARFWRIMCLVLYSRLSTPNPRDAIHRQRKAILRDSNWATSYLWKFAQLAWVWRGTAGQLLARTLSIFATAVFSRPGS